jgi:4-hydroxy-tetrahydrodipicolinate reductase
VHGVVRVGVLGAGGRMGQEVCRAVAGADDLELVAAVDPQLAGRDLREVAGDAVPQLVISGDIAALAAAEAEVAVDFTVAAAARENVAWCAAHGVHAVVGTTGLPAEDMTELARLFEGGTANAVFAANFAIGAVLLIRFAEMAAPFMDGVEVIELHHETKRDAPSGTAVHTVQRIDAARRSAGGTPWAPDPTTEEVLAGARGGMGPGGIRVHSVRLPGMLAHEEVIFGGLGQTLTIRHDAYDRRSFMSGVLLAVRRVPDRPGLTVGLDALLDL